MICFATVPSAQSDKDTSYTAFTIASVVRSLTLSCLVLVIDCFEKIRNVSNEEIEAARHWYHTLIGVKFRSSHSIVVN